MLQIHFYKYLFFINIIQYKINVITNSIEIISPL